MAGVWKGWGISDSDRGVLKDVKEWKGEGRKEKEWVRDKDSFNRWTERGARGVKDRKRDWAHSMGSFVSNDIMTAHQPFHKKHGPFIQILQYLPPEIPLGLSKLK